jgi:phenylacetate-CoA ligase
VVNENLLYLTNSEIREIQNDRLRKQISLLAEASPYYEKLFKENNIDVSKIKTVDDLVNIPVTTKKDYLRDPESFKLVHKNPNVFDTVWQVMYSAGTTTGKPAPFYWTTYDYYSSLQQMKKSAEIDGITSKDLVINLYPLTSVPHAGYHRALDICAVVGAPVVSALTGARYPEFPVHNSTDHAVAMIEKYRATVLMGIPSFIRRLLLMALNEKRDYSSVRMVRVTGESCHKGVRDNIHELLEKLGAENTFIASSFSSTETSGALGTECKELGGMHCVSPDFYYVEILDDVTYERLPPGEVGLLCFTHLNRRGTALLRFVLGDMVSITYEPCPHCGRNGMRLIGQPFRTSEIVKIKGTLINPDTLKTVLTSITGIDEYKIIFTKENLQDPFSIDKLKLQVSAKEGFNTTLLAQEVIAKVRNAVEVTPEVEFLTSTEIYDPRKSLKATRIVDERPRWDE